jgi:hypothetical protein
MTPKQQDKRDLAIMRTITELERMIKRVGKHTTTDEILERAGLAKFRHNLIQLHVDLLHIDGQV